MKHLIMGILLLFATAVIVAAQDNTTTSDCLTLNYQKRTSAWLCGEAVVCGGDICPGPSTYGFDGRFEVVLRDGRGKKLDSKTLSHQQRRFCFSEPKNGDYQLAFVLSEKGRLHPARVFPTKYKRDPNKPNDKIYMVQAVCPQTER